MTSVSIITPSYNQAEYIQDTIKSVRNQTFDDVTHIVIDGESDDGTLDILHSYENLDWVSEPDRGQTDAINKGFEKAKGEIIGWLNSDDPYVYRDTISKVVEAFQKTDADVVYGHAITIGPDNTLLRAHYMPKFDRKKLERHCYLIQPSVFFRGHVIDEHSLNEERDYSMDYEFWLDLAAEYDWSRINKVLAADRNHPDRKTIQNSEASLGDTVALRREHEIKQGARFTLRQLLDKGDLRWRRVKMLPGLFRLLSESSDSFAFDLQRNSTTKTLWTQLFRKKKRL